jgi:hypothetical protein
MRLTSILRQGSEPVSGHVPQGLGRGMRHTASRCSENGPDSQGRPIGPSDKLPEALMDVVSTLLVRPAKRDGEQAMGYSLRVAKENGLRDHRWLNMPATQQQQHALVRVCPGCLSKADPIWSESWLNRAHPLCAEHEAWLVDHCAACRRPLRRNNVRFLSCHCSQDLRGLRHTPLRPEARHALVAEGVPLHVLLWLGAFARYGPTGKPLKKASRQRMCEVVDLAQLGAVAVCDWPGTFFKLLDEYRLNASVLDSPSLLNEALPGFTKSVRKLRDAEWRTRISAAIGDYATASRETRVPLIGRNVPGSRAPTLTGVARELGIRPERLSVALDTLPGFSVATRRTVGGRCRRVITSAVAATTQRALADEISRKHAAKLLGFTVARVQQLILDDKLQSNHRRLSRSAVLALRLRLDDLATSLPAAIDAVSLEHALRYWIPVDRTGQLFDAIQTGELLIFEAPGWGYGIPHLVSESRVRAWLSAKQSASEGSWLTVPECAERLGLKQEVVYHLVRVGLIPARRIRADRRVAQLVAQEALREFEQQYEPLVRAAVKAGVDHRHGFAWAQASGAQLVTGPRIDGGRQYFVRCESVAAL